MEILGEWSDKKMRRAPCATNDKPSVTHTSPVSRSSESSGTGRELGSVESSHNTRSTDPAINSTTLLAQPGCSGNKPIISSCTPPPTPTQLSHSPHDRILSYADVAQLVERKLPKLEVAGSKPVVRSLFRFRTTGFRFLMPGGLPVATRKSFDDKRSANEMVSRAERLLEGLNLFSVRCLRRHRSWSPGCPGSYASATWPGRSIRPRRAL